MPKHHNIYLFTAPNSENIWVNIDKKMFFRRYRRGIQGVKYDNLTKFAEVFDNLAREYGNDPIKLSNVGKELEVIL